MQGLGVGLSTDQIGQDKPYKLYLIFFYSLFQLYLNKKQ